MQIISWKESWISTEEKVKTYIEVFGEAPWNEWWIDKEGNLYPLSFENPDPSWEKYYNADQMKQIWEQRTLKEGYNEQIAEVLLQDGAKECVWFALGWKTSLDELIQEKFKLDEAELTVLLDSLKEYNIDADSILFYASEMGVKKQWRGQGLWSKLYDARIQEVIQNSGKITCIVRTTKKNDVPYKRYLWKWFEEVYSYDDEQERVILVNPM